MSPFRSDAPDEARRAYEPRRLAKGARRWVKVLGPRQFLVQGTHEPWAVDLDGDPVCGCPDSYYRGSSVGPCIHELAGRLASGDMPLIQALGEQLLRAQRIAEQATARRPRRRRAATGAGSAESATTTTEQVEA